MVSEVPSLGLAGPQSRLRTEMHVICMFTNVVVQALVSRYKAPGSRNNLSFQASSRRSTHKQSRLPTVRLDLRAVPTADRGIDRSMGDISELGVYVAGQKTSVIQKRTKLSCSKRFCAKIVM